MGYSWNIKYYHFECGGEINVLVKSRRDVHNIHEINGIFTLVQKQSCAISSVTRNSFRNSVIGKWRKSEFWPSGWEGGGGRNVNEKLYCGTCWSASWAVHFFLPLVYSIQGQMSFRPKIPTVCNLETFKMSRDVSFTMMWHVWPANAQISLRHTRGLMISERSLCWSLVRFCPLCLLLFLISYVERLLLHMRIIPKLFSQRCDNADTNLCDVRRPPPHWKGRCP